jgi:hypothetical protein
VNARAGIAAWMRAATAGAVAFAVLALPGTGGAQTPVPPEEPLLTAAEASAELEEAVAALTASGPEALDPTDELRDLAVAVPYLEGSERRRALNILARPPDGQGDFFGGNWPASADEETEGSAHFVTHWPEIPGCAAPEQDCDEPDLTDDSGNGVPDYIDEVIASVEKSFDVENGDLRWPRAKGDGGRGGNSKVDVYVADICEEGSDRCIFGYAAPDDRSNQCERPPFRCFAYLVLDNDYQPAEFDYPTPEIPLRVTAAHEYNHILQFRLDAQLDGWMFESTAVWSEEHVFPAADDWLFYVRAWRRQPHQSITKLGAGGGLRIYGSAVWNHWLERGAGYGADVVLDSWRKGRKSKPRDFAIGAYDLGIKRNRGPGFAKEFARFTAATAEWRLPRFGFPDRRSYQDVKRKGSLGRGATTRRFALDHASYRLFRVKPGSANRLQLTVRAPRRVATGIALVARRGGVESGKVKIKRDFASGGGKLRVRLRRAQGFERITAVVTNGDGRVSGGRGGAFRYAHDNERFRAALRRR